MVMAASRTLIAVSVILVSVFMPCPGLYAQTGHLSGRISITLTQVPLEEALAEIGKAGHFRFSYNSDLLEPDKRVTVAASGKKVETVLKDLLGERVKAKEIGDHVILVRNIIPRQEDKKIMYRVTGTISEAGTRIKLSDVTVYETGSRRSALSGPEGRYSFPVAAGEGTRSLCFLKHGYFDTVVFFRPS